MNDHLLHTRLARAKILQALLDLGSKSEKRENLQAKKDAVSWIFNPGSDFCAWCDDADMHPFVVRKKAQEIIDIGLNWRTPSLRRSSLGSPSVSR